ncbi:glycosyltransferase family 39 protein [Clostridium botulinum]|uniref:Dolichyl-phosphate-mannose-mannosyltransferase family protein n=2 Tax=Clostridium botulinum TaxID=1491 RepID=A0A0C3MDW7_CLOBO|nr:glycosyltransferase family 39 protein [Clostridium botulinum]AJD25842.1 dolichyl-phosphate-mannose-mannosyltransferase family protein [Clostridium botulinum CDC_297]ACQ53472.1 putative membrane protein [Clostridium botulinum Ba4 str. 657]AJE10050.1 dolichyl-phosphate-mannose-mannosyltransferase family protein [Clostridium botulinum CDC_1436]APQ99737.1 dolichyl-phosphate-mannose-mannosyltransferase family protein [Clostridium botulinum]APU61342.1 dolichyl-phosphate-mannose-mannosyltransferas
MEFNYLSGYENKDSNYSKTNYYKIIIGLSMVLCILWVIFVDTKPFSDFEYYYNLAVSIANGGEWGDTYTSVGYSIVLGGLFKLFGASLALGKIFNLVLTFFGQVLFLGILRKIKITERNRKIVFTLFVLFPNNIFFNSVLGTEILFTTLLLLLTYLYFSDIKYKYVILGVLVGATTMVKPFFLLYAFAIFLVELLKEKSFLKSLKSAIIIAVVALITISPWVYRNTKYNGERTFVSNNGGIVLYINNNSQNNMGRWMSIYDVENSLAETEEYKKASYTQKNKMLNKAAKEWIKSHPKEFVILGFKRLFNTYMVGDDVAYSIHGANNINDAVKFRLFAATNCIRNMVFIPAIIYVLIYSIFILIQIIKRRTENLNKFNLYATILFHMFTSVYFITEGQGRYAFPLIFIIIYFWVYFIKHGILLFKELKR